jgi:nitrite reductase/ring-hydroxylating ferredoxin subunit
MKFDVKTGCFAGTMGFGVTSYPIKVAEGKIFVALGEVTP